MRSFFDGSRGSDSHNHEWLTLAGYTANNGVWDQFDRHWETMLRDRYPIAPYIHMTDLLTGNDPFERIVGWTEDKRHRLIFDALNILQQLPKEGFCAFICSVDATARDYLVDDGYVIPEPAAICARLCFQRSLQWYFDHHPDTLELVSIYFDRDEPFIQPIREVWLKYSDPRRLVQENPAFGLITEVSPVIMSGNPGVQAADVLAWAKTRSISAEEGREGKHLFRIMTQIIPSLTFAIDEASLRRNNPRA
jgi:hypothetical protein